MSEITLLLADVEKIQGRSHEELAEWWCTLNSWEWPDDIPNPESIEGAIMERKTPRRDALMDKIKEIVPHKLISYAWNKDRMSVKEHDEWFARTFGKSGSW